MNFEKELTFWSKSGGVTRVRNPISPSHRKEKSFQTKKCYSKYSLNNYQTLSSRLESCKGKIENKPSQPIEKLLSSFRKKKKSLKKGEVKTKTSQITLFLCSEGRLC